MKILSVPMIFLIVMSGLLAVAMSAQDITGQAGLASGPLITTAPLLVEVGPAGLAIGVREPDRIGGVHVLHTTESGPSAEDGQYWNQDHPGVDGVAMPGDKFGNALVWGDFDGDGFPDLAIGNPIDSEYGSVNVLYGTPDGISATGSQYFEQGMFVWVREKWGFFGETLAAGDFNNDGYDDLVIGFPGLRLEGNFAAGGLRVLYGSDTGLVWNFLSVQWIDQKTTCEDCELENFDRFGDALAVGNFNGDEYDDLAVGVPYENIDGHPNAGTIDMLYGSPTGLVGNNEHHHQGFLPLCNVESKDMFGYALAAGDFDHDGYDDLAIGVPYEDKEISEDEEISNAGLVNILYGTSSGFEPRPVMWMINQDSLDISGSEASDSDLFGFSLAAGDLNGDGYSDLVIGSPRESQILASSGGLNVVYGSADGLTNDGAQWFDQDSAGVGGAREAGDRFGHTLAVGDLNGDGFDDLLVGVPFEDMEPTRDAGLVNMFFGSSSGLKSDERWMNQSTTGLGEAQADDRFGISLAIWPYPFRYTSTLYIYLPLLLK